MQCLRCKTTMKHYKLYTNLNIFGALHKPDLFSPDKQTPHSPQSVYICENCGYVEFSMHSCENPDI